MTASGPWGDPPRTPDRPPEEALPPGRSSGRRRLVWPVLVIAALGLLVLLIRFAPGALRSPGDWAYVALWTAFVVAVLGRMLSGGRAAALRIAGYGGVWAAVIAVLIVGYLYRAELAQAPQRLRVALGLGAPVATGAREVRVARDDSGAFLLTAQVNGTPVRFLVDTGATDTVLGPADARRLGIAVDALRYDRTSETANGLGYGAAWTADRLEVGPMRREAFPMVVNKAPMTVSLLGMTFLDTLESFEIRGDQLILRWRE